MEDIHDTDSTARQQMLTCSRALEVIPAYYWSVSLSWLLVLRT